MQPYQQNTLSMGELPTEDRPITAERIRQAMETLHRYRRARHALEERILANEQWYRLRHWDQLHANPNDPKPTGAWMLNCILNKHADAMDSFPQPVVLPREESDREDARLLSAILPVIREQNGYEQVWSDMWWYKLKTGTGAMGVFWDGSLQGGLGDIAIRKIDLLNLYWEPGITNIQASRNLFHLELMDRDLLLSRYPMLQDRLNGDGPETARYAYQDGTEDVTGKVSVADWYYKVQEEGRTILHYCKFVCGCDAILFATENEPAFRHRGLYAHGQYPFVLDTLFPVEGSPCGFGYVDLCRSPQTYIDRLDQVMLKYAIMAGRPRFFIRGDGKINEEEYADWSSDFIHFTGAGDPRESVLPLTMPELPSICSELRARKIEELKETSGNRDFQQGGTTGGVSAASAIEALQEAGSKLSRDMLQSAYRADAEVSRLCLELIREFYTQERTFRITAPDGGMEFLRFSAERMGGKRDQPFGVDFGRRVPVFDIRVRAEKANPFTTDAQNERAKELFRLGFFRPENAAQALCALEMMHFEGVEQVRARVAEMAAGKGTAPLQ